MSVDHANGRFDQDDAAHIQSAVDGCPTGQVVSLTSGTFTIGDCHQVFLRKSVTVRGAGAGTGGTLIQRTDGASVGVQGGSCNSPHFIIGNDEFDYSLAGNTALAADGVAGTSTVQVASTAGLSVGEIVLLDESNNLGWQTDWAFGGQVWSEPDRRITFNAHKPGLPNDQASGDPPNIPCYFGTDGCDRYVMEMKQIASIGPGPCPGANCTVTFDDPIMITYRASLAAHLAWFTQLVCKIRRGRKHDPAECGLFRYPHGRAYCWVKNAKVQHSHGWRRHRL
jgi:polygalacturonase